MPALISSSPRSIPACAGEPSRIRALAKRVRVDPRVRGGAIESVHFFLLCAGRSPRARGSRRVRGRAATRSGSIPACAGEPGARGRCRTSTRVDPRVRGGADQTYGQITDAEGRSPRARGSRSGDLARGEIGGRSPRARGSPASPSANDVAAGSIPACAGEPAGSLGLRASRRVDPRVRGGASHAAMMYSRATGRSPRARGSRLAGDGCGIGSGSIPACAGEPEIPLRHRPAHGVDPRVRGGAIRHSAADFPSTGRSPRARGSLVR